ncbi:DUF3857 domain-containing protein [Pontibacter sp. Tf4]|uniref:DUF3857 domain-containing protein n=1 Tax=Pontibacter sp. Tf4 TaxID=2761620 RepID=UPI0016244A74|nr:DUF3857 domain-containing protein [Pontibacter sp. Tf4]MBB6612327.1 DUF3857 domain-containing protein [Pontibacter sp. Tf4]
MRSNFTQQFTLLLFSFFVSFQGLAQVSKFGVVTNDELTMKQYPLDTAAGAVILFDKGYTKFGARGIVMERHVRIKVLKKTGYEWANFEVPYIMKGKMLELKGITYNLENGVVQQSKLDPESAFDEKYYEDWYLKKFTLPNVKEGSVMDVTYTIQLVTAFYNLPAWEFQRTIPTAWSEYHAEIPNHITYKFLMQGYHPLHSSDKQSKAAYSATGTSHQYTWIMKDVPALREENFITTLKDYQTRIEFELQQIHFPGKPVQQVIGNWEEITKELMKNSLFGGQINGKTGFKNVVAPILAESKTREEAAEKIYDHVRTRMTWNKVYGFGPASLTLRKAYDDAKGNIGDINLLLIAMLREASFDANPVLVSTRNNGRPPLSSPLVTKFNYLVAQVEINGKEYLLDATEPLLPFGLLPERALNAEGHLIKTNASRWIALTPGTHSKFLTIEAAFTPQGELNGKMSESAGGYYALELRKALSEQGEEKFSESLAREAGNYKLAKPTIQAKDELRKPLQINYEVSSGGMGQLTDIIYLNPLLSFGKTENPLKLDERLYPVDFVHPIDETIIANYTIPDGYVVDEAPKGAVVSLPEDGGRFTFMVQQNGNQLQVMSRMSISKPLFYVPEYPYLKEFYNQIIAKHAEQIVLKKASAN